ncbi:hypothetical protein TRFO_25367 [Tritrichomonas foetus]|uniref:Uncharacterized protein n=1 Tax=Tritrichomonas foetus TaxID=1144522 RepID=A0A1J4K6G1_9EUKA|nr:hypothetical protein TRFO_25367 [Tritrichomonas foetus]|eukprot:OHT06554.1 hypothetical protein TRFO_25367 [Tritrichomonas foetus]
MLSTPRKLLNIHSDTSGNRSASMMTPTDVENTPFIYVRDYQKNVENLENENFTLKLLLSNLFTEMRDFSRSKNLEEDLMNTIIEQEKKIANLSAEIGKATDYKFSTPVEKRLPQSPSLKQQLKSVLDSNLKLINDLKKRNKQQIEEAVENSEIYEEGAQTSVDHMEIVAKATELSKENKELNQRNYDLINENHILRKELESLRNEIEINRIDTKEIENKEIENALKMSEAKNEKLTRQISLLEKQLEEIQNEDQNGNVSEQNSILVIENMNIKNKNKQLIQENKILNEKINDANKMINNFQMTIQHLENGNVELMNAFNVLEFEDIGPKFEEISKENSQLRDQNNQLSEELANADLIIVDLKSQLNKASSSIPKKNNDNGKMEINSKSNTSTNALLKEETDILKYQKLVAKKQILKNKKWALQSSINRLLSGNYVYTSSTNKTETNQNYSISFSFADNEAQLLHAKKEKKKLLKEVEELHEQLNQQLYSKIKQLSNDISQYRSIQVNNNELREYIDQLVKNCDQLQCQNMALTQQVEILKGENEDLIDEVDNLRRIHRELNNSIPERNESKHVTQLKQQIKFLQDANNRLRNEKSEEIVALKNEISKLSQNSFKVIPIQRENEDLKKSNREIKNKYETERDMKMTLTQNMMGILNIIDDRTKALLGEFDYKFSLLLYNFQKLINFVITLLNNYIRENKKNFQVFAKITNSMISDLKRSTLICLKGHQRTLRSASKTPISKDTITKLLAFKEKWDRDDICDISRFINEENEKSLMNIRLSAINLPNSDIFEKNSSIYSQNQSYNIETSIAYNDQSSIKNILENCQILIHIIWDAFGNGKTEPQISTLLQWENNGRQIIQTVSEILSTNITEMKTLLKEQEEKLSKITISQASALNPSVISILKLVRRDVKNLSQELLSGHKEIMTIIHENQQNQEISA